MTNYPIGDFLIQIKNAAMARNKNIAVAKTKIIKSVALTLKKEGYLEDVKDEGDKVAVRLSYRKKKPVLIDIKIVSKPGLRRYINADDLEKKKGPSSYIISTSKGIMFSKEALQKRIGGEVIAEIL